MPTTARKDLEQLTGSGRRQRSRKQLYREQGRCTQCGRAAPLPDKDRCAACHTTARQTSINSRRRIRDEVFTKYGGCVCACCGEVKDVAFLQIDHVDGGGSKHLDATGRRRKGNSLYRWLRSQGYPAGFQVLCADCNFAKGQNGECPHQTKRREVLALQTAADLHLGWLY